MKRRKVGFLVVWLGLSLAAYSAAESQKKKFNGYAEWRKGDLLIVDGQRIRLWESAKVKLHGDVASFGSLPLGFEVKGKGRRLPDGILLAEEIEAKPNGRALFELELSSSFDTLEQEFRRRGRVCETDEDDRIVVDYGALLESGPEVDRVLEIAAQIAPSYLEPVDFRVYAVVNREWNAMAAPNGSIYVFTGLLEDMDDDEVAIVLGHELAHATHEHSRKELKRGFLTQLALMVPIALAERAIDSPVKRTLLHSGAIAALLALQNGYSREHEDQADRVGLRYAHEGGFDVRKGPRLWQQFAEKYGNGNKVVNFFLGSHSRSRTRAELMNRQIELNYEQREVATSQARSSILH